MGGKPGRAKKPKTVPKVEVTHGVWCLMAVGVGFLWTALGCCIAAVQGDTRTFLEDWVHLQGFFLVSLGTWLLLIVRSKALFARIANVAVDGRTHLGHLADPRIRIGVIVSIGVVGTASLIALGFPAHGSVLVFMWVTCALICFTAGVATLHTLEIIKAVGGLLQSEIKVFRYAPALTPELRSIVSYFTSFTLLVTIGYAFALLGTLAPDWIGSPHYLEVVRIFWPIIYVPTCTVALIYPHIAVHKLIQREKEETLLSCQEDMDGLLTRFHDLKAEDIDRTNTLAQLFDRIAATPNYVVDFGIALRTILPLLVNVVSFFANAALSHGQAAGT